MAKRSSELSQPVELKRATSGDIAKRKWTKKELDTLRRISELQTAGNDAEINFDDIPRLTEEQLSSMVRLRDVKRKISVSVRLDPSVLTWLKSKGQGHLTRINDILCNLMQAESRAGSKTNMK